MIATVPKEQHNTSNIDLLRGAAALLVVISHLESNLGVKLGWFSHQGGWLGVQIFFVISGYLIVNSAYKYSAKEYFMHRFFRIFPTYWIWYFLFALTSGVGAGVSLTFSALSDPNFYANLALLNHFIPQAHLQYASIGPSWTLSVELAWYILVFFMALTNRKWLPVYCVISIVAATWWIYGGKELHPLYGRLGEPLFDYFFITNAFIAQLPYFLMGAVLCFFTPKFPRWPVLILSILVLALFTQWSRFVPIPIFISGIAISGIFWFLVTSRISIHGKIVKFFSDISYSLYLVHYPVIVIVGARMGNPHWAAVVATAASIGMAYVSYRLIEKPFMRMGRRLASRP